MTVADLIKELSLLPKDASVILVTKADIFGVDEIQYDAHRNYVRLCSDEL